MRAGRAACSARRRPQRAAARGRSRRCSSAMDRYRAYVVPGRGLDPEQAATCVDGAAERGARAPGAERPRAARRRRGPRARPRAGAGAASTAAPGRRVRRAVPADLRAGDGQGHRGHRVLPLVPARRRSTRWAATPTTSACRPDELPRVRRSALARDWPHDDDHALDPRHQALRGRAGPAAWCSPSDPTAWAAWLRDGARAGRRRTAPSGSTGPPSTSLWQTLVGAWPIDRGPARRRTCSRRSARPSCTRAGPTPRRGATRTAVRGFVNGAAAATRAVQRHRRRRGPRAHEPSVRANVLSAEAAPADHARRARRLPGLELVDALAGRPRQPPAGRLRPTAASGSTACSPTEPARRPRRREAAGHRRARCGCAATWPGCSSGEGTTYAGAAHHERARPRLRAAATATARRSSRWSPALAGLLARRGGFGDATVALPAGPGTTCSPTTRRSTTAATVLARRRCSAALPGGPARRGRRDGLRAPRSSRCGRRSPSSRVEWTPSHDRSTASRARRGADGDADDAGRPAAGGRGTDGDAASERRARLRVRARRRASRPARPAQRLAAARRARAEPHLRPARLHLDRRRLARAASGAGVLGRCVYELHVGTFTPEGTLDAAVEPARPPRRRSASTSSS